MGNRIYIQLINRLIAASFAASFAMAAHADEVVFGHISSTTHPSSAANAKELQAGIKLAFDAANAKGGVNGNTLKLEVRDDNLDAVKMVAITDEFVQDPKIIALLGFLNTGGLTELSKADAYRKYGIAQIVPYQGNQVIVEAANVFPFRSGFTDEVTAILKETKSTYKRNIAIVHHNIAFGPAMGKFATEQAAKMQIPVTDVLELDGRPNGDMDGSIAKAITALKKSTPDAILLVAAGKLNVGFLKGVKGASDLMNTQVYGMSVIVPEELVAGVGEKAAQGLVVSQAVPYPFVATTKLVSEYHRAIKSFTPSKAPSFSHLEGYIAGQVAILALKKVGAKPTRQSILKALYSVGQVDLGGAYINYSDSARKGWGQTELVIFGRNGKLVR